MENLMAARQARPDRIVRMLTRITDEVIKSCLERTRATFPEERQGLWLDRIVRVYLVQPSTFPTPRWLAGRRAKCGGWKLPWRAAS